MGHTGMSLQDTVTYFQKAPSVPGLHEAAQRKYNVFCRNRTPELYQTFFELVGPPPDFSGTRVGAFTACAPFRGKKDERTVSGMSRDGVMHGLVRYEYHQCLIEECRVDGREHGLRVVCTQMGDIWIRLFSNGNRLAQIVLSSDYSIGGGPVIDEGGLKML